ncbi:MAG: HAMP domain-containing histidine kinase [Bdellovibrionales bacterium]|nr:HAMP domain-containing histidine kinase [Bdellovibrionales bacterium]
MMSPAMRRPPALRRLRYLLGGFFVLLSVPFLALLFKTLQQLDDEQFYRHRRVAEHLAERVDERLKELMRPEETRPFGEYQFFSVEQAPLLNVNELRFSPLAEYPPTGTVPGLLGYFQITPDNRLSTPVLPDVDEHALAKLAPSYGISPQELRQRISLKEQITAILATSAENRPDASPLPALNSLPPGEKKRKESEQTEKYESASLLDRFVGDTTAPAAEYFAEKARTPEQQISALKLDERRLAQQRESGMAAKLPRKSLEKDNYRQRRNELIVVPEAADSAGVAASNEGTSRTDSFISQLGSVLSRSPQAREQGALDSRADASNAVSAPMAEPEASFDEGAEATRTQPVKLKAFEGAIDPFQAELIGDGHVVLHRRVWHDNQRFIQGFVLTAAEFFSALVAEELANDPLLEQTTVILAVEGTVYRVFSKHSSQDVLQSQNAPSTIEHQLLLVRESLPPPLQKMNLLVTVSGVPRGPGQSVVFSLAGLFLLILLFGLLALYRLGVRQLALAEQQRNFVSAVSHELRTPLTSIRMYGEMLRDGMVPDEQKRHSYYSYIFVEAERLSRLISNVLRLSNMGDGTAMELTKRSAHELLDMARSRVESQCKAVGFTLTVEPPDTDAQLLVDEDSFLQILINLADNALKFSKHAARKEIVLGCSVNVNGPDSSKQVRFYVRDFGPGVSKSELRRIFELFYRAEDELTRTTPGTGIGLALVDGLARAMQATVDVQNRSPGSEFSLSFASR